VGRPAQKAGVGRSDTSTGSIEKTDGEEDDTLQDKDSDADTDAEGRASGQRDAPARHNMKTRGRSVEKIRLEVRIRGPQDGHGIQTANGRTVSY